MPLANPLLSVWTQVRADKQETLVFSLQFDEEFSARQEAQAESQKKEERIKELEEKIQALESQVKPSQRKKRLEWNGRK